MNLRGPGSLVLLAALALFAGDRSLACALVPTRTHPVGLSTRGRVSEVVFAPDGRRLVLCTVFGEAQVVDLRAPRRRVHLAGRALPSSVPREAPTPWLASVRSTGPRSGRSGPARSWPRHDEEEHRSPPALIMLPRGTTTCSPPPECSTPPGASGRGLCGERCGSARESKRWLRLPAGGDLPRSLRTGSSCYWSFPASGAAGAGPYPAGGGHSSWTAGGSSSSTASWDDPPFSWRAAARWSGSVPRACPGSSPAPSPPARTAGC